MLSHQRLLLFLLLPFRLLFLLIVVLNYEVLTIFVNVKLLFTG